MSTVIALGIYRTAWDSRQDLYSADKKNLYWYEKIWLSWSGYHSDHYQAQLPVCQTPVWLCQQNKP